MLNREQRQLQNHWNCESWNILKYFYIQDKLITLYLTTKNPEIYFNTNEIFSETLDKIN